MVEVLLSSEYYTSLLNSRSGKTGDKLIFIMAELSRVKITFLPGDINLSEVEFSNQKHNEKILLEVGSLILKTLEQNWLNTLFTKGKKMDFINL